MMDQAVEDGSLATYMLAAGAQGLANVGLGIAGLFDAVTDDGGGAAAGAVKALTINLGPELLNGATALGKTVLDGYSYGLDVMGVDASGFRNAETPQLDLLAPYANDAEQGGALIGGLLSGSSCKTMVNTV